MIFHTEILVNNNKKYNNKIMETMKCSSKQFHSLATEGTNNVFAANGILYLKAINLFLL